MVIMNKQLTSYSEHKFIAILENWQAVELPGPIHSAPSA